MSDISIPQGAPTLDRAVSSIPDTMRAFGEAAGRFVLAVDRAAVALRTHADIERYVQDAMRDPDEGYTERFYSTREVRRRMRLYGKRGKA